MNVKVKVSELTKDDVITFLSLVASELRYYALSLYYRVEDYNTQHDVLLAIKRVDVICYEDVLAQLLYNEQLYVEDSNDNINYLLTYEKLCSGIEQAINKGYVKLDIDDWDAQDGVTVLQMAIFNEVIYG